jgi:hypothetical protein
MSDNPQNIQGSAETSFGVHLEYPSIKDVRHYLRNLGWEGRFEFVLLASGLGNSVQRSYDIEHFIGTLTQQQFERVSNFGNSFFIELDKLIIWIRDVVGDVRFAEALENAVDSEDSNYSKIDTIRAIGISRLNQYFEVLEEVECRGAL